MKPGSKRTPIWSVKKEASKTELNTAISIESVFVIDSIEKLKECEQYFKNCRLSNSNLLPVRFAAEWVISLFDFRKKELALIQLAVKDRVYLIDFDHFSAN